MIQLNSSSQWIGQQTEVHVMCICVPNCASARASCEPTGAWTPRAACIMDFPASRCFQDGRALCTVLICSASVRLGSKSHGGPTCEQGYAASVGLTHAVTCSGEDRLARS